MSDAEIIKDFLIESYENLDRLDQELVTLEKDPRNRETLASIFRTIHSIKGTSGFLAFHQLEALTHTGENLLARLRDGLLELTPTITTALLAMVDAVRQMLAHIESEGSEGVRDDQELIETLTHLVNDTETTPEGNQSDKNGERNEPLPGRALPQNIGDILVEKGAATASEIQAAIEQQRAGDPRHLGEILVERGTVKPQDVVDALHLQRSRGQGASDSTIRVDVAQLDRLMNQVGELVLLRNQIMQYTNASESSDLQGASQRLNLLTTELQEGVMKTRMQPIGNIWSKFPRTVRDLAVSCGKQVRIEMEGKETELDKTIIEAIKDPLTHLVRNAVDHGIENQEMRRAAGKDPEGRLFLRAFHEGGQVNIEITDDGAGLDIEKVRNKALQKSLITADQAARMTEREITNLIFLPGFSTASTISNVSGRGVGMDVVKINIEKIGGTVDVQSRFGRGCTVRLKIPLTLAIIPALTVTVADDRYAIPQVSLLELVRLEGEQLQKGIELIHGVPVHRLRGRLLPLVYLDRELRVRGIESEVSCAGKQKPQSVNIVVLRTDDRQFGLVVDEINDTQEIVVKPLNKQLKSANIYAGATIMGDGKVVLILDVPGLAQRAGVLNEARVRALVENEI
ncbi:MAG TPA: chemotaxis protein CheA, partial [Candidatus Binataceae bacterium]|nr:chemotaxis protein CheA [Candidatus Binataceae bacterium]